MEEEKVGCYCANERKVVEITNRMLLDEAATTAETESASRFFVPPAAFGSEGEG